MGTGKTSLLNGLLGKEVGSEGIQLDPVTTEVELFTIKKEGVSVKIWDTPGSPPDLLL